MVYATADDLAARLAPEVLQELADDDGDTLPDTAVLGAALAGASAEIDQTLAGRYVTPLEPAPEIARRWCADLAIAALYLRRLRPMPKDQADQAALTRRALEALADGLAGLAGAQPRLDALESDNTRRDDNAVFSLESLELY